MALGWKKAPEPDDPRLQGHETTYQASRGGWFKAEEKPVPGTPKEKKKA
ncbi:MULTISPECIES: hypothetical protein [Streptomyces]|nr:MULTISPECIES: hypothetical protein [Streptomyces]MBE4783929.1 hypothetical protein [Streptomyces caniscabiei]MBE4791572.1 hypothetical protein [Streptomyces caniscabiei]MDX3009191.1 hypothetical protein [Streptomyces caniscabiei]MDX3831373.1 hypothetical protein [Streptomyces europaeiscabiei]